MDAVQVNSCFCVCMLICFHFSPVENISPTEDQTKEIIKMGAKLKQLPSGNNSIHLINLSYNEIAELPDYTFWNNSYRYVKQVYLCQNKINSIGLNAFRGLKQMKILDISDNNLTRLDPYTFKSNTKLHKLMLINNFICFDRLQTFIISHSIETLVLSNNQIDEVYDVTFLGLPNLRRLIMSDNELTSIEGQSFKTLSKLSYLSIANTGVYFLDVSMFRIVPRILNIENTPLADIFEPPLTIVRDQSVKRLLELNQLVVRNLTQV